MFQELGGDTRFKTLVLLILIAGTVALGAYTYLAYKQGKYMYGGMNSITVQGKAERFVRPDIATFSFSVVAEDKEAAKAQEKSASTYNAILEYLKGKGIEEKDIKTEHYNLGPKYEYTNSVCNEWGVCPPGKQNLVGYTVDQTVSVKIRKIEDAGTLIAGVGNVGATNVSGLSFTIDDIDKVKEEIRAEAIADAKKKAQTLAGNLDVRLGKMINYYEDAPMYPMPAYAGYGGMEKMQADAMIAPQITPGESEVVVTVNLVFEIK